MVILRSSITLIWDAYPHSLDLAGGRSIVRFAGVGLRGAQVAVLGQVARPGRYPLESTAMKVTDALALAEATAVRVQSLGAKTAQIGAALGVAQTEQVLSLVYDQQRVRIYQVVNAQPPLVTHPSQKATPPPSDRTRAVGCSNSSAWEPSRFTRKPPSPVRGRQGAAAPPQRGRWLLQRRGDRKSVV